MKLTEREREILKLFCYKTNEISDILKISESTTKTHIQHLLRKFKTNSKVKCLVKAVQMGELNVFDIKTSYVDVGFWDNNGQYKIDMQELIK
jgi:DNA-binding CsgD family transcriptional regulator